VSLEIVDQLVVKFFAEKMRWWQC
jgi:hypothetical protein